MSKAWRRRNLIGFFFPLAFTCLLAFNAPGAFAEPVSEAPAVSSIAVVSSPARGDTYELGEAIDVVVEFDPAVAVTGLPRLNLNIGTETRHAIDFTWVSHSLLSLLHVSEDLHPALRFRYTVQEGDKDEDGIGIPANALTLDGATIKGPDGTTAANLTHAAVAAEDGHKVDGSLVSPPAVKSISLVSSPASDDMYELGETIRMLVQFDREVTVTGRVQIALTIGEETRKATSHGWGSTPFLYFDYTVQEGDKDEDGIGIPANSLALDDATIKGPDGTTDADLAHETVVAEGGQQVDGSLVSPPAVMSISFFSSPTRDDTYERGETIQVLVQFDRAVTVTGRARVPLTIGEETRQATSSGWDTDPSPFVFAEYTVQEGDRDEDGISIEADALVLNGETIRGPDGTTGAHLTHAAVPADGGRKVDGSLASPPAVRNISFISFRGADDTYQLGETVEVMVEFDKPVRVTGSPQVALIIGSETRHAVYPTSWGAWGADRRVRFEYTVQEGDWDEDGISIPANALSRGGGTITAADGTADADLTHEAVAPERDKKVDGSSDVAPPRVRGISIESAPAQGDTYQLGETIEIEVEFDRAVKTTREPRLALTIGTQTRHATGHAWGHFVSFRYTVQAEDRDEDGISIPANALSRGGGTITAADGTTDALLTHEAMAPVGDSKVNGSDVTPPRVRAIRFGYSPPARGDTYELGETIEVAVEFHRAVTATGEPQVALTIGAETRHAAFRGWGRETLYFDYTVQVGDRDVDGISIPANALVLRGGTIKAADGRTDADLTHPAIADDGSRKVNASLVSPPAVSHISFTSYMGSDDTYELGETVEVVVEFDKVVTVTGTPQVALTIGDQVRHATYSTLWGSARRADFSYEVQEGDWDDDGISIAANSLLLNGGTITSADGSIDADLTHAAVPPDRDTKVDGISDVTPPRVRDIRFDSSPARGDTYELGETVEVVVEFDGAIETTGEPQLALTIGAQTRRATRVGWSSHSLYFEYTVQAADRDEDGISIPANALNISSGAITAPDGTTRADLTHAAVAAERGSKVNGSLVAPPRVSHIFLTSSPGRGDTYARGETIEVEVEFDRTVTVTGAPRMALTIGAKTRHAAYSGSWRAFASFSYRVREDDRDEDGISIPANALLLNGGAITAADGTTDADLTHASVAPERAGKVDGSSDVTPPRVVGFSFVSSPATADTYGLGETVEVEVAFDGAVTATGSPLVALTIGTETRYATEFGWSSHSLRFRYTVRAGDRDDDGISIPANALRLNGGTITAPDGVTDAVLTHTPVTADRGTRVNGSDATPPQVKGIRFAYSPARGATYELGETIEVEVEFDRAVTATGDPEVALTIGTETSHAALSRWGNQTLFFDYTVQERDRDEDGIGIPANALRLNSGTIKAVDGTTDADLTHAAVPAEGASKVNGSLITPPAVTNLYFVTSPARGDTYQPGETIEVLVVFDRAVTVTGSPQVALTIGKHARHATYFSTSWDDQHAYFSYEVQEGDRDDDGINIPASSLLLNGGTITHANDSMTDADLGHDAVAADPGRKVSGSRVSP